MSNYLTRKKMIKRSIKMLAIIFVSSILLTSCYSFTTVVGSGPQGSQENTAWNSYIFWGLGPVGVKDAKTMAGDAENYSVNTKMSFVNGLVSGITFGIYSPRTITVTK